MANLPTDMELEQAETQRNATRTPSPQLTPCEQLKYNKAQLAKMETFRRCKQACVDALMMMPDHHPDEPFYVRALTELHDIEEAMALAVSDIDSFEPCIIPGCPHHEKTPQNSPLKSTPDTNYSGKRKEISNFEYPPPKKNGKKSPVANENPNGSNNSASQNAPQNQLPPPIMLFVEKNYKAQMAAITKTFPKIRSRLTDIEHFIQTASNCILFGDFNATHNAWNCKNNTTRGRHLFNFANMLNLNITFPSTPTRFRHNSANTIDIALIKNFYYTFTIDDLSSDPNAVFLNFNFKLAEAPPNPRAVSTDWKTFKINLNKNLSLFDFHPNIINNTNDLEQKITEFTEAVIDTHSYASRPIETDRRNFTPHNINQLIKVKNYFRKRYHQTFKLRGPSPKALV
ncbi:putative RNA-directed DNA polymerase from transposon BS [Trichonephila clavipes]|nr:putative RNA-directed DNA polymerase from transposon BS [Trichonephila clavipes]